MYGGYFVECQYFRKVSVVKTSMKVLVEEINKKNKKTKSLVNINDRFLENLDPAKLHVLRAHVPTCLACLLAHVPTCFMCLRANVSYVLTCSRNNESCVLSWSRANVPFVLMCSRANLPYVLTWSRALRA